MINFPRAKTTPAYKCTLIITSININDILNGQHVQAHSIWETDLCVGNLLIHLICIITLWSRYCFISILQRKEVKHGEATWLAQGHSGKGRISNQVLSVKKYCVGFCPEATLIKDGGKWQCYEISIIGIHILIQCLSPNIWQRCWRSKEHPFFPLQSPAEN